MAVIRSVGVGTLDVMVNNLLLKRLAITDCMPSHFGRCQTPAVFEMFINACNNALLHQLS